MIKKSCDKFGSLRNVSYVCSTMSKLIISKNLTQKSLSRSLGGNLYSRPGWDIASTKEELVAYLTQFQPSIISIGTLDGLPTTELAKYVKQLYDLTSMRYPRIILAYPTPDLEKEVFSLFKIQPKN